jgi:hypothetical protein
MDVSGQLRTSVCLVARKHCPILAGWGEDGVAELLRTVERAQGPLTAIGNITLSPRSPGPWPSDYNHRGVAGPSNIDVLLLLLLYYYAN